MRKLNAGDLMKMVSLFGKIGSEVKLKSEDMKDTSAMGIRIFTTALQYAENEISEFLASIAEMDLPTFHQQGFDYPLEVIEQIVKGEDFSHFLQRLKALIPSSLGQ
jgi:hypothetical protein